MLTEAIEFCEKEEIMETTLSGRIPRDNPNQPQMASKSISHKSGTKTPWTKEPLNPVTRPQMPRSSALPIAMVLMDAWFTFMLSITLLMNVAFSRNKSTR